MAAVATAGRARATPSPRSGQTAPNRWAAPKPCWRTPRGRTPSGTRRGRGGLLPDASLIHEPRLDPRSFRAPARRFPEHVGPGFSNRACAFGSAAGGLAGPGVRRGRDPRASRSRRSGPQGARRPGHERAVPRGRPAPGPGRAGRAPRRRPADPRRARKAGRGAQAGERLRVVAVDPVAERLAGQAGEPCGLFPRQAVERVASASRRALTRPSCSRRARRRSSAASWSVRIDEGAGTAASPRTMPPQRLGRPVDPSPIRPVGMSPNTVHFTMILMTAAKSIRTVGCGVRDRSL